MDSRPIGIFDSGVGGLTVVKAIRESLPQENLIYIGDTARVPYGTRSPEVIKNYSRQLTSVLLQKNVKALVVACNTISSIALPEIVSLASPSPVIDVINPTIILAQKTTHTKHIAVIGTAATINSHIYKRKLKNLDSQIEVIEIATPLLVPITEERLFNHPIVDQAIDHYLAPLKKAPQVDTLILGCTHYPLIRPAIASYLGPKINILDSAQATAAALKDVLTLGSLLSENSRTMQIFFTSDNTASAQKTAQEFLGENLELEKITI